MSAAAYPVAFFMNTQRARAHLYSDGTAIVQTSTQEFGTGTPTVLTQVAADALGVDLRDVRVEFGDTSLPGTGSPVGSNGAMMISAAVHNAGHRGPRPADRGRRRRPAVPAATAPARPRSPRPAAG